MGFVDLATREFSIVDQTTTNYFSPDSAGRRIAYQSVAPTNTLQYFLYEEANERRRQLTEDPEAIRSFRETGNRDCPQLLGTRPLVSADGSIVVLITSGTLGLSTPDEAIGCRFFLYEVDEDEWKEVAALPRELVIDVPTLNADVRWLSFSVRSRPPELPPVASMLDLETGELQDPLVDVGPYVTFVLGRTPYASCPAACDVADVTVDCLTEAVGNAIGGCF